ncbi:hypothetical protein KR084_005910, partial [Drosophila pseudotakahashii]
RLWFTVLVSCILLVLQCNILEARRTPLKGHHRTLVKSKHVAIKARTNGTAVAADKPKSGDHTNGTAVTADKLKLGDRSEKMYSHCHEIFKEKNLVSHVIRGMVGGILDRLNELCVDKPIHPLIHRVFTETLLCGGSLSEGVDSIIDIIFGQSERQCRERPGFRSVYILTSAENEVVETKH